MLLLLALIGVVAYYVLVRPPGTEVSVSLQGYKTDGSAVTREEMEQAASVIRQRLDTLGVKRPEVQLQGQDQMIVNVTGITDTDRVVEVIGRTGQLGFYEVLAAAGGQPVSEDEIEATKEDLRDELEGDPVYEEGETQILFEESPAPEGGGDIVQGYIVPEEPGLTGEALESAIVTRDQEGRRQVQMDLTSEGADGFGDLSQQIVDNALVNGFAGNGRLAVVLDEDVVTAPGVQQAITGGQVVIENQNLPGGLPEEEAEELEIVLQTGALPVDMEVLSVTSAESAG